MSSPPLLVAADSTTEHSSNDLPISNGFSSNLQVDVSDDEYSLPSIDGFVSSSINSFPTDPIEGTSRNPSVSNKDAESEQHRALSTREELLLWIKSIKEIGRCAASTSLSAYKFQLPDLNELIKEWPPAHQELFRTLPMKWPTEEPDSSLEQHVDLCIALLKIPNEKAQFQAMQLLFSLYVELTKSLHYKSACHDTLLQLMSDLTRKYRKK